MPQDATADFSEWIADAEPRLRHALTASFGPLIGEEVTADAVAHAWEHWADVARKENPIGYVYVVARNRARRLTAVRPLRLPAAPARALTRVEPGLPAALSSLSEQQRLVVSLLYGYEWTMAEVAELLGTRKTTVQNHAERGLRSLRRDLGVES